MSAFCRCVQWLPLPPPAPFVTASELGQSLLGAAVQVPPAKIQIAQRKLHLHSDLDLDLDLDSDSDSDFGLYLASIAAVAVAFAFIIVIAIVVVVVVVVADVATNFWPNAAQNCLSKLAT